MSYFSYRYEGWRLWRRGVLAVASVRRMGLLQKVLARAASKSDGAPQTHEDMLTAAEKVRVCCCLCVKICVGLCTVFTCCFMFC